MYLNIFKGPCPQNKEEVELLKKAGVKAILNLQRDEDMERMNIKWSKMKEIYYSKNMDVVNYQIKDKSPDKIGEKILKAAFILNEMIKKSQVKKQKKLFSEKFIFSFFRKYMFIALLGKSDPLILSWYISASTRQFL